MLFWGNRVRNSIIVLLVASLVISSFSVNEIAYAAEVEETEVENENENGKELVEIEETQEKSEDIQEESQTIVKAADEEQQEIENVEESEYEIMVIPSEQTKYDALKIKFHGQSLENCYLLVNVKEGQNSYQYSIIDPLSEKDSDEVYLIYRVDENAKALPYQKTDMVLLSNYLWKAPVDSESQQEGSIEQVDTLFYVVEGQISVKESEEIVLFEKDGKSLAYLVQKNGQAELYTGIYENYYYENGEVKLPSVAYYQIVNGYLYYVSTDGTAQLVIKDEKNTGTYLKRIDNIIYKISYKSGRLIKFCGLYKGYFYKNGVIAKGKTFYAVYKSYIYKVSTSGKAKVYTKNVKKKSKKKSYYAVVFTSDLKYYLYQIQKKTGKVKKYVKSKSKSGNYMYLKGDRAYKISYKTGEVTAFYSGIYKNKMYVDGKFTKKTGIFYKYYVYKGEVVKKTGSYYIVYDGYVYKVAKDGKAVIYIKNKDKEGTYAYVKGGYRYTIEYATGKIVASEQLTDKDMRQLLVDKAVSYLGYSETAKGKKSHVKILNIYNAYRPLPRSYAVTKYDAWCATYVSAMFIAMGYDKIMPIECSCWKQVEMWKNMGRWKEKDSYIPKPGDIIYYDWQDSGIGDNKGVPDHVGIVVSSTEKVIMVIEGNKNDRVEYRTIKVNGKFIRGFGLPNYYALLK